MSRNDLRQIRSFIAVELGSAIAHRATEVVKKLKSTGADIRWTSFNQYHLTLKFLGNIDARDIVPISRLMQRIARESKPIELGFHGVGAFPSIESPKTIWLGVREGLDDLKRLQGTIEEALKKELGFAKERRQFTPHITLGRVERETPELARMLEELSHHDGEVIDIDEIALYSSHLGGKGQAFDERPVARRTTSNSFESEAPSSRQTGPLYEVLAYAVLGQGERPRHDLDDEESDDGGTSVSDADREVELDGSDSGEDSEGDASDAESNRPGNWRQSAEWTRLVDELEEEFDEEDWDEEDELEEDDPDGDDDSDEEALADDKPIPPASESVKAKFKDLLNEPEEPRTVIDDAMLERLLGKRTDIEPGDERANAPPRKKKRET